MRLVLFANNWVGLQVLEFLVERGEDIAGLVLHEAGDRRYADEMLRIVPRETRVIEAGRRVRDAAVHREIAALGPDLGISAFYGYLFPSALITAFPRGMINVHPSLLPHNRGIFANVWTIVDRTPAGATLHHIDPGVDSGDVIAQREVRLEPVDTGFTLYEKLMRACVEVFRDSWDLVRRGDAPRRAQEPGIGKVHKKSDVAALDRIDLDKEYKARDLLDLLRARSFPPHRGAYFETEDGRRVYLTLHLEYGP